jgi:RNA polymerase sigma factor (sigma-70 family)
VELERAGPEPFADWYERTHPQLLGSVMWVCGDPDVTADVVDEAFARALSRWSRVGGMRSPEGWVYRVALNVWRRSERRRALEQRLLRRHPPRTVEVTTPAGEVWEVVKTLPVRQRTAIALRYVADLTESQISEIMGVRRSTVSVLLRRAHERLAALLEQEAWQVGS